MSLLERKCVPCEGSVMPLLRTEANALMREVPGWSLAEDAKSIAREYQFRDFAEALAFVNAIGAVAEREGHHPDIEFGWGRVRVVLSTHAIGGLSPNDFIVAAKIDASS